MKTLRSVALACAVLASSAASLAQAANTTYSTRADFEAALAGAPTVYDFETGSGFPAAPASISVIDGAIGVSTEGGDSAGHISNYLSASTQALGGRSAGDQDSFKPLVLLFNPNVFAVGFDNLDLSGGDTEFAVVDVVFGNGAAPLRSVFTDPDFDYATSAFFGLVSSDPILGIRVFSADNLDLEIGVRPHQIDNLTIGRPIPEPSSAMLLTGVGSALALVGRRRSVRA